MNDRFNRKGAQPVWKSHEKTSAEKEAWLRPFEEDENLRMMDEEALAKARRYAEELCREDNVFALRLKGYACYGGNRLYECDWTAARDCMLRLRELTDDAEYANTLGYIYYYGRCNGGEPEYEKAFSQFSYAAANGLFEAIYKLGDLYSHGYGCRKSEETAQNLYHMVYNETKKKIPPGVRCEFCGCGASAGEGVRVWHRHGGESGGGLLSVPGGRFCGKNPGGTLGFFRGSFGCEAHGTGFGAGGPEASGGVFPGCPVAGYASPGGGFSGGRLPV